jgi:hypothetical protein
MNPGTVSILLLVLFGAVIVGPVVYFQHLEAKRKKLERWGLSDSND